MRKQKVALFGASGTMGFQAFQELWKRRDRYDIVILVLPSEQKLDMFREYERAVNTPAIIGPGVVQGDGLKIVWGDATCYADVLETIHGVDWVLDAMAYISPAADYHPELAKAVNTDAIHNILRAIEAEPGGAERIRFVYTGTVAQTGNRPAGIHMGRVGDPLKPSIFDTYALTKIAGERAVLESPLRYWASLRMTFIMPTSYRKLINLMDAISLHMPLDAYMENLTDRDAGFGLVNCLDIPAGSDFWRRVYNMGGGAQMRCLAYDYLDQNLQMNGLSGLAGCTERRWFAKRNFHMQYFEDSWILNQYIHHWRDTFDNYLRRIRQDMSPGMKIVSNLCRFSNHVRRLVERITYRRFQSMAENHRNGTAYWYNQRNDHRISAFYKNYAAYEQIPDWNGPVTIEAQPAWRRLDHGYDESKAVLNYSDLAGAATFRGGQLLSREWDGDLYTGLKWQCAFEHRFTARPYTILKAGHWCPVCIEPPWNFDQQARRNPYFAQVWYADHQMDEDNFYPDDCTQDIVNADKDWELYLKQQENLLF